MSVVHCTELTVMRATRHAHLETNYLTVTMPNIESKNYGFFRPRGMGYGLMRTYGLWYENSCPPSRWIAQGMGYVYEGLWVNRSMDYKGFDFILIRYTINKSTKMIPLHSLVFFIDSKAAMRMSHVLSSHCNLFLILDLDYPGPNSDQAKYLTGDHSNS